MGKKRKKGKRAPKHSPPAAVSSAGLELQREPAGASERDAPPRRGDSVYRRFTAALSNAYRQPPIGADQSGDYAMAVAQPHLLAWARHLDQNNPVCVAILDELVNQIVGAGVVVDPYPTDRAGRPLERLGDQLRELYWQWSEKVDTTGELDASAFERHEARSWLRDGEIFSTRVLGRGSGYPFQAWETPLRLELRESENCPLDYDRPDTGWRYGVQLDEWRRPTSFAFYRVAPNDWNIGTPAITWQDLSAWPASDVQHLKSVRRWPQTRGVSIFAPVITAIHDLVEYEESERIAARVAASMTGYIRRDPQYLTLTAEQKKRYESGAPRELEMQAGQFIDDLLPGEDVGSLAAERPNTALVEFRREMIRGITAGCGARYSPPARDYGGTWSSQRQELVEARPQYDALRQAYVRAGPRERYRSLVLAAALDGQIVIPPGADLRSVSRATYTTIEMDWVDPEQQANAIEKRIELGLDTREDVQRRRGMVNAQSRIAR